MGVAICPKSGTCLVIQSTTMEGAHPKQRSLFLIAVLMLLGVAFLAGYAAQRHMGPSVVSLAPENDYDECNTACESKGGYKGFTGRCCKCQNETIGNCNR